MINNRLGSYANLGTLFSQSVNNTNKVILPPGVQTSAHLSPNTAKITDEVLSQFSDEQVDQILHQQLSSSLTIASGTSNFNYKMSSEQLALHTVISSQQEGLLKNEHSSQLMDRLNTSVKNIKGAYANTSDILSDLGQLGFKQQTFLASSQQRVERSINSLMDSSDRDGDNYAFELSITTKEGDVINIAFNSAQGYDKETGEATDDFSVSYEVEGDLSEAEHQALTQVLSGVGEMADEFFSASQHSYSPYLPISQPDLDLDFLNGFDSQQLAGFDLYFSTPANGTSADEKNIQTVNELKLSYDVDDVSQQQTLQFESQKGQNEVDFTLDMSTIGGRDKSQMQQYLSALDKSLEDNRVNSEKDNSNPTFGHKGEASMKQGLALFKNAFSSMSSAADRYSELESVASKQFKNGRELVAGLVDNMITKDPRYKGLGSSDKNTLGEGISKLADFDAKFSFAMDGGDLQPKSTVELSQTTEQEKSAGLMGVKQSKAVSTHFNYEKPPIGKAPPDYYDKKESYNINAAVKDNELVGLDQSHNVKVDKEAYRYNPFKSRYELTMALKEETSSESNIRLINDIWLETNEDSYSFNKKQRATSGPDEFITTKNYSHNKLVTLIGDLDKLEKNQEFRSNYLAVLSQVNDFMD